MKAALSVNTEMIRLYWQIGKRILEAQEEQGGAKVIVRLAEDLRAAFPDMTGFSATNLKDMRAFAEAWPDLVIGRQAVAQLPWGHNLPLLRKLRDPEMRTWYAKKALEHGWSRGILDLQIETRLHEREGKDDAPTIGLLLVRGKKNRLTVEYALQDISKPMGVSECTARPAAELPKKLREALPSVEQIEEGLGNVNDSDDG